MPQRRDWAASCTAAPALRGEPHGRSLRVPTRSDACGLLPFSELDALYPRPRPNLPDDPCCNARALGRRDHRLGVVSGRNGDHPDPQIEYATHFPERHFAGPHQHAEYWRPGPRARIHHGLTSRGQHAHQVAGNAAARDVGQHVEARQDGRDGREVARMHVQDPFPDAGRTVAQVLLDVHTSYFAAVSPVLPRLHALAHITGGGIPGNLVRVLPAGCEAVVDARAWPWPPVFRVLMRAGEVSLGEMRRVFNLGVGMIAVAARDDTEPVIAAAKRAG